MKCKGRDHSTNVTMNRSEQAREPERRHFFSWLPQFKSWKFVQPLACHCCSHYDQLWVSTTSDKILKAYISSQHKRSVHRKGKACVMLPLPGSAVGSRRIAFAVNRCPECQSAETQLHVGVGLPAPYTQRWVWRTSNMSALQSKMCTQRGIAGVPLARASSGVPPQVRFMACRSLPQEG